MGAKLIGMKIPSAKIEKVKSQVDAAGSTMLYKLSSNAEAEMKRRTPIDSGKMMKCWKKTPLVGKGTSSMKIEVYNTATNDRTGYLYPLALEYGFHHYAWGKYVGFHAGLYFREYAIHSANVSLNSYIPDFYRKVLRVWR